MYSPKTFPEWFQYLDDLRSIALLTPDGAMNPELAGTRLEPLALLAVAIHAASGMLSENELRRAEQFLAMHRWRVAPDPTETVG
jgi:hypothetical protein